MESLLHNIAFVCNTKAQIFNAINIRFSLYPDVTADIYLCSNGNDGFSTLAANIKQSEIFDNTYYYFSKTNTDQSFKGKLYKALRYKRDYLNIVSQLPRIDNAYDAIFISGPSSSTNALYYYFKERFPFIRLFLFEEGVCEYYILSSNRILTRGVFSFLVHGRYFLNDVEELYVYGPSLVQKKNQNVVLKTIPKVSFCDDKLKNLVNKVFDFNFDINVEASNGCILFIDQAFPRNDEDLCQKKILKALVKKIGRDKILVKMHPRSSFDKYTEFGVACINSNQTLEMIEYNWQLKNLTIVSVCSSALFNFKLIFGVNSSAILLYKLFESQAFDRHFRTFIESFIAKNSDMNIMVPNSYEELYEMI